MTDTKEKLWAENRWLREELRRANVEIAMAKENNPLADRFSRITFTLLRAITLLRKVKPTPEIIQFLKDIEK